MSQFARKHEFNKTLARRVASENGKASTRAGFTLIELMLSMILGGMLMAIVAFTFANMAGSFAEQPASGGKFDWDVNNDLVADNDYIPYSPAYSQLPSAFALQTEIMSLMQTSLNPAGTIINNDGVGNSPITSIYVISSAEGQVLPSINSSNNIFANLQATPAAFAASSAQFYTILNPVAVNADTGFSLYFIRGKGIAELIVHCRISSDVDATTGEVTTTYRVKSYLNGVFAPEFSYAYAIKGDTAAVTPSSRLITLRDNEGWNIHDEVGTQVVFPDPTVLPYQILSADAGGIRTFSRFAIFLPVKP